MTGLNQCFVDEILAEDAWNLLSIDDGAALVDVRSDTVSHAEGGPDLAEIDRRVLHIPWRGTQLAAIQAHFAVQLQQALDRAPANHLIFYSCNGEHAAEAARSIARIFDDQGRTTDISTILPSDHDADMGDCWRAAGLPWRTTPGAAPDQPPSM